MVGIVAVAMFVADAVLIFVLATLALVQFDLREWAETLVELSRWSGGPLSTHAHVAGAVTFAAPLASAFFITFSLRRRQDAWPFYLRRTAALGVATGVLTVAATVFFFVVMAEPPKSLSELLVVVTVVPVVGGATFSMFFLPVVVPAGALLGVASAALLKVATCREDRP